jgi:deoxyribodipyrimidine photo-lyase
MKKYKNGLFIFRRDYRIVDNIGLNNLHSICENIYTIFIFTPEQVGKANDFKSNNAVQFMIESLDDLDEQIQDAGGKLQCFYGDNVKIISEISKENSIDVIGFNYDYTPYSTKRDNSIIEMCNKMGIQIMCSHDYYLLEPGTILNGTDEPYQKFTPFYTTSIKNNKHILIPSSVKKLNLSNNTIKINKDRAITLHDAMTRFTKVNENISVRGGRIMAKKQLLKALKLQSHYSKTHNMLDYPTSQLSAYIKFGCVSIREVYKLFKENHDFIRQLFWRDFYINILYSFPHVLGKSLKPKYNNIKWSYNTKYFEAWKNGNTGFPVVDAGMRELNETGYMHNRARLIVASFLVKTLLIDWRKGEQYFASKLTDYDVASNNGNWQWIMGGGADSQPYFRIFNPWLQAKEYDPETNYIKMWIPELIEVPEKAIHKWYDEYVNFPNVKYSKPIVVYEEQKEKVLNNYAKIF